MYGDLDTPLAALKAKNSLYKFHLTTTKHKQNSSISDASIFVEFPLVTTLTTTYQKVLNNNMIKRRCGLCLVWMPNLPILKMHLIEKHSKAQLASEYLKQQISQTFPKVFTKKRQAKFNENETNLNNNNNNDVDSKKIETLFSNASVQILCRDNDIIIRDDKSSVDMEFSFNENSNEDDNRKTDELTMVNEKKLNKKFLRLKKDENTGMKYEVTTTSSSSASSEDHSKKFTFKKKIRKRKNAKDNTRHYKINITRSRTSDDNKWACTCQGDKKFNKRAFVKNLKLASDTDTASETGKGSKKLKVFCHLCGNGYKDGKLLMEHIKIHANTCRLCNEVFLTTEQFKEHIQTHLFKIFVCHVCSYEFPTKQLIHKHYESHIEDSVLESVIDMEEEYKISPCRLSSSAPYDCSINSIMCYLLNDNLYQDLYSNRLSKIFCDICFSEVYKVDYHAHMQNVHCVYGYNWPKE